MQEMAFLRILDFKIIWGTIPLDPCRKCAPPEHSQHNFATVKFSAESAPVSFICVLKGYYGKIGMEWLRIHILSYMLVFRHTVLK